MSLRPLMKFVVKHSCQYNKNSTQKMYGKWKEEKEEGKRKEEMGMANLISDELPSSTLGVLVSFCQNGYMSSLG